MGEVAISGAGRRESLNAHLMRAEVGGDHHRPDHRYGRHREIFQIASQGARQRPLKLFHIKAPRLSVSIAVGIISCRAIC